MAVWAPIAKKLAVTYVTDKNFRTATNGLVSNFVQGFKNNFAKLTSFAGNVANSVTNRLSGGRPAFRMS